MQVWSPYNQASYLVNCSSDLTPVYQIVVVLEQDLSMTLFSLMLCGRLDLRDQNLIIGHVKRRFTPLRLPTRMNELTLFTRASETSVGLLKYYS